MTIKKLLMVPVTLTFVAFMAFGPMSAQAAGSIQVGLNPLTITQNGPSAVPNVAFAYVRFDASASTEDVLVSKIPFSLNTGGGASASYLSNCRVINNSNNTFVLNTGSNSMNVVSSNNLNTFVLDNAIRIPSGGSVVLTVVCDILATNAINNTYQFTMNPSNIVATSAVSGSSINASLGEGVIVGNGTSVITTTGGGIYVSAYVPAPGLPNTGGSGDLE